VTVERLAIRVEGRVQGVGFRFFTQDTAQRLGVSGWVRNTADGAVEAEAQASPEQLCEFVGALRKGPPIGHVTRLTQRPCGVGKNSMESGATSPLDFRIRYR
jgi:acylphosphatase